MLPVVHEMFTVQVVFSSANDVDDIVIDIVVRVESSLVLLGPTNYLTARPNLNTCFSFIRSLP